MVYPDNLIFSLELTNGYVFRQIFEMFDKLVIDSIPIYFKECGVTIRASALSTRDQKIFTSDIEIFTDDIIEYYINTDLTTIKNKCSETPCQIEEINMTTVKTVLKSITKAKSVRLYKTTDNTDICIEIKGVNKEISKITSAKPKSSDHDISKFEDLPDTPNVKIDIGQFCDTMKGITRDTDFTNFKIYQKGLVIEARNRLGSVVKENSWGYVTGKFYECAVGTNFTKALCKINSMANYSIVKIYSNKDKRFKLNHKIGDFGEHNIYISE